VTEVAVVPDVAAATAELFVESVAGASAARGRAAVALTGGSSAPPLFTRLLSAKHPWEQTDIYISD
jgi:6-phosphogluconolactonase/glucosamine-6-phosphate isomerase/deaminase